MTRNRSVATKAAALMALVVPMWGAVGCGEEQSETEEAIEELRDEAQDAVDEIEDEIDDRT